MTRMDMHCHSWASDGPALAALGFIGCPECYSPPEKVYDQAMARGMDLVTITDHDTIKGAMELVQRGFQRFIPGQEVTVYFPEDRCKLHVLVWGLSPDQDEQITSRGLRQDIYAFGHWLAEHNLPHSVAHPLYIQNGRLTLWHVERCAMLFKCFETLNGAHMHTHRAAIERYLDALTPSHMDALAAKHGFAPLWPEPWKKGRTGGSDDHGLLNVGKAWTTIRGDDAGAAPDPGAFLARVMRGDCEPGGVAGHSSLLAHQLTKVGAQFYRETMLDRASPRGKYIANKLLRFAGVEAPKPSKAGLAIHHVRKRLARRKRSPMPVIEALRASIEPMLIKYPELRDRLDPAAWTQGPALADHDRMAAFADDLTEAMTAFMSSGALEALRKRDKLGIVDHTLSYLIVQLAQIPYIVSLFHQNKERVFIDRFEHETSALGSGVSVMERPMRVSLFTDTLGDVNGVCRFIQNVAEQALNTGRDLHVITSTRLRVPTWSNIFNFEPVFAAKMPRYQDLEFVLPPLMRIMRHVDRHQPDAIHISTPGPVGFIGFLAAKMLRVPILGVYHTDFPAYVDHLFDDHAFTWMTERFMSMFYAPFHSIFTRSEDYVTSVTRLGIDRHRVCSLMPGVDVDMFHARFKDPGLWTRFPGVRDDSIKILYVGRISVEKNMPFLTGVWKQVASKCHAEGLKADLILVGDGPYRETMQRELAGLDTHFLGFRHGEELSALYASSHVFVFPSVTDTLGQVVMESQASGIPVLVTDVGGPKEVVRDGETGYVLTAGEAVPWVDRIVSLVRDNVVRRRMGAAAHAAMQPFSIRNSFEHFWEAHERAWRDHLAAIGICDEPGAAFRPVDSGPDAPSHVKLGNRPT